MAAVVQNGPKRVHLWGFIVVFGKEDLNLNVFML